MTCLRIIVQRPGHPELRRAFTTSPVRFGRSAQNELPLPETYVSEHHGAIRFDAETIELTDLGSTNGTTLNGERLAPGVPARAEGSTIFQIGPLTMLVEPAMEEDENDVGLAKTGMASFADVSANLAPPATGQTAAKPHGTLGQPTFNPPTLFGDRPYPAAAGGDAGGSANSPGPQGDASPRGRVVTQAPPSAPSPPAGISSFNPPTLFGMSAGVFSPSHASPPSNPGAFSGGEPGFAPPPSGFGSPPPAAGQLRSPPAPAAPVAPAPAGEVSFNPPTLFGMSGKEILAQGPSPRAPSPSPAAPGMTPQASPEPPPPIRFNPPTLFGDKPMPVLAKVTPAQPAAFLRPGGVKPGSPPTLFGVASGAVSRGVVPLPGAPIANPPVGPGNLPGLAPGVVPPPSSFPGPDPHAGPAWPAPADALPAKPMSAAWAPSADSTGSPDPFEFTSPPQSHAASVESVPPRQGAPWSPPAESPPARQVAQWPAPAESPPARQGTPWPAPAEVPPARPSTQWPAPAESPARPSTQWPAPAESPPARRATQWPPPQHDSAVAPPLAPPAAVMQSAHMPAAAVHHSHAPADSTRTLSASDRGDARSNVVLRAFCDAFIDLRRGFEEAGAELGVRTVSGSTPLHLARDGSDLLRYMTDPVADPNARAQELRAFIADFAVHQVAMMEGVNRGVRAMLTGLDPQEFGIEKGPKFMPILDKERWRLYTEQFSLLLETDHELNQRVFGSEFAEGYASVMYGAKAVAEERPRRPTSKPTRRRRP